MAQDQPNHVSAQLEEESEDTPTEEDLESLFEDVVSSLPTDLLHDISAQLKQESKGTGTEDDVECLFQKAVSTSLSTRTDDESTITEGGAGGQREIFFFATLKKGQPLNRPPNPEDIALFAAVVNSDEEVANRALPAKSYLAPLMRSASDGAASPNKLGRTKSVRLIPVNGAAIDLTSSLWGAAVGFSIGGPVVSLLGASAANYVSRDEQGGDIHDITQIISESTITSINLAGAVLHTFDVDELILSKAQKDELQPWLSSAKGTLKAAGDVLSAVGDLNFLFVKAVVNVSNKVELPKKTSALLHDWWRSIRNQYSEKAGGDGAA